jgi:hypothetical protein
MYLPPYVTTAEFGGKTHNDPLPRRARSRRRRQRHHLSSIDRAAESTNTHSLKRNGDVGDLVSSRRTNQAARSGQSARALLACARVL